MSQFANTSLQMMTESLGVVRELLRGKVTPQTYESYRIQAFRGTRGTVRKVQERDQGRNYQINRGSRQRVRRTYGKRDEPLQNFG